MNKSDSRRGAENVVKCIYTWGHSRSRGLQDMFDELARHGVAKAKLLAVDVRYVRQGSRNRRWLQEALTLMDRDHGLDFRYKWQPSLGNPGRGPEWVPVDWQTAMVSLLEVAADVARTGRTPVLICCERDWRRCHRRHVAQHLKAILDALPESQPVDVVHLP